MPQPGSPAPAVELQHGVTFRRDGKVTAHLQWIDVDLAEAQVVPTLIVAAEHVQNRGGNFVGDAKTVREWASMRQAIAGINGGFFGDTYDQVGRRKQIVQLAVVDGKVVAPGSAEDARKTALFDTFVQPSASPSTRSPDMVWGSGAPRGWDRATAPPLMAQSRLGPGRCPTRSRAGRACSPAAYAARSPITKNG